MSGAQPLRHVDQPKVCDNGAPILQKYILSLEIFVHNALVVEVAHAQRYLLGDQDDFVHEKLVLPGKVMTHSAGSGCYCEKEKKA